MHRKTLIFIFTTIWLLIWASPSIALDNAYKKAIDAYKSALRINPKDEDTRHNLALSKQQNQEQQKEENKEVTVSNKIIFFLKS